MSSSPQGLPVGTGAPPGRFSRFEVSALSAAAILAVSLLVAWLLLGNEGQVHDKRWKTLIYLSEARSLIMEDQQANRVLPENIQDASENWSPDKLRLLNDAWGHPLEYQKTSHNSFLLRSLGRDGKVGGIGEDEDLTPEARIDQTSYRASFTDFISSLYDYNALTVALAAAAFWGVVIGLAPRTFGRTAVAVTSALFALVVAYILTLAYQVSASGH